jgi:NAD(P)-dependent dehydrogenase (short-subunit alcohol dehydrogenase family)
MTFSLKGKTALITGGASGIGRAIARELASAGASVVIADMDSLGEQTAQDLRDREQQAVFVQTDMRSKVQVIQAVNTAITNFGSLDILINNAGIYPRGLIEETDEDMWDQVISINLKGPYLASQAALPYLRKNGGSIINIGSSHADIGLSELFAYSASKGGLLTMTRNLANTLSKYRIRVNCVNPGWVATEKEIKEREANGQSLESLIEMGKSLPLGRMQTEEDTSAMVRFLVSDQATQITGQFIHIDGGRSVYLGFQDNSLHADDAE